MKLVHPNLEYQIKFIENEISVLIVENQEVFLKYTKELFDQINGEEGQFVLSEDGKLMKIPKVMDLIFDFYALEVNSRKVLTKLYSIVKVEMNDEIHYMASNELVSKISNYLELLISDLQYSLDYDVNFDLSGLMKVVDLRVNSNPDTLTEKLVDYMMAMKEFCGMKVFVFVGLKNYLLTEELELLYQEIAYQKYKVLMIEGAERGVRLDQEIYCVIAHDLCEIY